MINYDIRRLAASVKVRRKGTSVLLPPLAPSLGAQVSYLAALRKMLSALAKTVREDIVPVVSRELQGHNGGPRMTQDVDSATFERLRQLGEGLGRIATATVLQILGLESQKHTAAFMQTAKKTLGIDLTAVVRNEDLGLYLETAATRNAALIRGINELVIQRVQTTVVSAVLNGETAAELKRRLTADFGFADARARLIARDQIAKVTSDLNRIRHVQAGISEYGFDTSADERVRPSHKAMDGRTCRYDNATVYRADDGTWKSRSSIGGVLLHPGQDIQCRCVSRGLVRF